MEPVTCANKVPPLPQEKERLKAEKDAVEKKYKTAKVDGRVEQVTQLLPVLHCCAAAVWCQAGTTHDQLTG